MRNALPGLGAALLAGGILAACGNEPEPLGPAGSSYESTNEPVQGETAPPITPRPETPPDPFAEPGLPGSEPGEIPEVIEEQPQSLDEFGGDTTMDQLDDPERDDAVNETGAPL